MQNCNVVSCVWSVNLREERRLRVFDNRVLREIFEPKKDEVAGEWRRKQNEVLYDMYCSPNIIRGGGLGGSMRFIPKPPLHRQDGTT